jgi:GNAT superfamily N-acetyltransferase
MALSWIHENPPRWDAGKAAILGGAAPGTFDLSRYEGADVLPGEWWRVEDDGRTVAYGWMDYTWGEGEMLLAVDPARQGGGIGTYVLDRLEAEARERKLRYLYNVVRDSHPDPEGLTRWLEARGFRSDRGRLVRRVPA